MATWADSAEISRAIGLVKCLGENGGAMLGLAGSQLLLTASLSAPIRIGGLELVFVVPGVLGLVWVVVFLALVPTRRRSPGKGGGAPPPWRALLTEPAALATYFNHGASSWLNYLLLTELPSLAAGPLGLTGASASAAVATPYIFVGSGLLVGGRVCDACIARGFKRGSVRVTVQAGGAAAGLLGACAAAAALRGATWPALGLLNAAALAQSGTGLGACAVFLELSKKHSGVFYAISNVFATIPGIVAPLATTALIDSTGQSGWIWSFGIGGLISFAAVVPFASLFFGTSLEPRRAIDGDPSADLDAPLLLAREEGSTIG